MVSLCSPLHTLILAGYGLRLPRISRFAMYGISKSAKNVNSSCQNWRRLERNERKYTPVLERYKEHYKLIGKEVREHCNTRRRATHNPDVACCLIIDGADQSAFGLPHFFLSSKTEREHSLKVKIVGVIDHGASNRSTLFLITEEFETGANHVIEALHRTLCDIVAIGRLPDTVFIQMDNCTCKKRYTLFYLKYLVKMGVFLEVIASFLPVGYTHEEIYQLFSRTASRLRCRPAVTLEDLATELRQTYSLRPEVAVMRHIANFSLLLSEISCL